MTPQCITCISESLYRPRLFAGVPRKGMCVNTVDCCVDPTQAIVCKKKNTGVHGTGVCAPGPGPTCPGAGDRSCIDKSNKTSCAVFPFNTPTAGHCQSDCGNVCAALCFNVCNIAGAPNSACSNGPDPQNCNKLDGWTGPCCRCNLC